MLDLLAAPDFTFFDVHESSKSSARDISEEGTCKFNSLYTELDQAFPPEVIIPTSLLNKVEKQMGALSGGSGLYLERAQDG